MFEHHHLLLIGIWVYPPYTVTLAKLALIMVIGVTVVTMKWWHDEIVDAIDHHWLLSTCILDIWNVSEHHHILRIGIWVHPYTVTLTKLARLVDLGSLWLLWNDGTMKLLRIDHHWSFPTSILFKHHCLLLIGIWVHPYTVTLAKLAQLGNLGSLWLLWNDGMMTLLRL